MKLDMRYKRFQYMMNKILEAEKMSAEKQAIIDGKKVAQIGRASCRERV